MDVGAAGRGATGIAFGGAEEDAARRVGIDIAVESPTLIAVRGADKQRVGQIAADIRAAVTEPEVLRAVGEESRSKGTDKLTSRQIDQIIKAARELREREFMKIVSLAPEVL